MAVNEVMPKCKECDGTGRKTTAVGERYVCTKCGGTGEKKTRGGMVTSYNNSQSSVAPRDEDGTQER